MLAASWGGRGPTQSQVAKALMRQQQARVDWLLSVVAHSCRAQRRLVPVWQRVRPDEWPSASLERHATLSPAAASGSSPAASVSDADTPSDESKKQYSYSSDANDPGEAAGAPSREISAGRIASGARGSTTAGSRERAEGADGSRAGARGTPSAGRSSPTVGWIDATDRTSERRA